MLILDVDGVLTNGTIVYTDAGEEYKCFNTQDGLGMRLLLLEGIRVALISGRDSKAVSRRAEDLGITDVYQGIGDKVAVFRETTRKDATFPLIRFALSVMISLILPCLRRWDLPWPLPMLSKKLSNMLITLRPIPEAAGRSEKSVNSF